PLKQVLLHFRIKSAAGIPYRQAHHRLPLAFLADRGHGYAPRRRMSPLDGFASVQNQVAEHLDESDPVSPHLEPVQARRDDQPDTWPVLVRNDERGLFEHRSKVQAFGYRGNVRVTFLVA